MDIPKIKRNIQRMIDQGAPESDIDAYVASEGATPEMLRGDQSAQVDVTGKVDLPKPELSLGEQAADVAKSLGSGLRQGVEATLALPGDMAKLQGDIVGGVASQFGASPETVQTIQNVASQVTPFPGMPTSDVIRSGTEQVIGQPHEPETTAGEFAETIGEFVPAAVAPGGVVRKAAQVVVPAIASEAAGQATEDTAAEPFARAAAALLGGFTAAGRVGKASKELAKSAPNPKALRTEKNTLYKKLESSGVRFNPQSLETALVKLENEAPLHALAPKTYGIMNHIRKGLENGGVPGFEELEGMRKLAGRLVRSSDSEERLAASMLRDALDDFSASAPLVSTGNMSRKEFVRNQKKARELARRVIQEDTLADILEDAATKAAGVESGIRTGVGGLLRSKRGKKLFRTPAERKALLSVSNDRKSLQQLSRFGFDITGGSGNAALIPGATALTGAATGNPLAIAATVGGTVAKQLSPALTKRALAKAQAIVRAGPGAQKQAMTAEEVEALEVLVRRAIAANNARTASGN